LLIGSALQDYKLLKGNPETGLYNRDLPKGCELCRLGGKLVVYVTGECGDDCYYCPVSFERFGKPVSFANERPAKSVEDYLQEAYRMGAMGAGITGGDPILAFEKVVDLITTFKEFFGPDFHVHLYTSGRYANLDALRELKRVGLDEIRFHPVREVYWRAVENAVKLGLKTGLEVPAIEDFDFNSLIQRAKSLGVSFVNINELEITPRNAPFLRAKGLEADHGLAGNSMSHSLALSIMRAYEDESLSLHYCTSIYKDIVETRNRFIRTFKVSSYPFEDLNPEGTVVRAIVKSKADLSDYGIKEGDAYVVSPSLLEEIRSKFEVDEVKVVEMYPSSLKVTES
jgi:pyruvate formate-lyase activating enzyme-like uncharacterized protein